MSNNDPCLSWDDWEPRNDIDDMEGGAERLQDYNDGPPPLPPLPKCFICEGKATHQDTTFWLCDDINCEVDLGLYLSQPNEDDLPF